MAEEAQMNLLFKLAQMVHEALPAKKRVYFLYTHKNGFDRFNNGLKANTEISFWVYKALRNHFPNVRFLRFQGETPEKIRQIRPQDVVIGHIGETLLQSSRYTNKLIAFGPWSGSDDRSQEGYNCILREKEVEMYDRCAALILLTSEFNKQKYVEQPGTFWQTYFAQFQVKKRVRLVHQPLDLALFKRIKWEYTTSDFIYIGNTGHMKCVEDAVELVRGAGRQLTLYGIGERKLDHLNRSQVDRLPREADFFIQPGLWEAQCVSILEAAARGFIPIVTEETGYPYKHPFLLRPRDNPYNARVLKKLLDTTPNERRQLADSLHGQLLHDVEHNNWKKLTDVIVEEVRRLFI